MSHQTPHRQDPAAALRRLRDRISGGGRPALEDLAGDEMAAANELICRGEAEVICSGCHLYLTATLDKDHDTFSGVFAATKRVLSSKS